MHKHHVNMAVFSPDGRKVATTSYDNTARVWDAETGEPLTPFLPHAAVLNSVAFSPDGRMIAFTHNRRQGDDGAPAITIHSSPGRYPNCAANTGPISGPAPLIAAK